MRLFTPRVVVFAALLSAGPAAVATAAGPMGAGFTYQGQLKDQGLPLTGDVDLRFSLVDVEVGGAPFGELNLADVAVANGLFSVQLDFGANVFNGNPRWLEVAVRFPHDPSDTLPFTTLIWQRYFGFESRITPSKTRLVDSSDVQKQEFVGNLALPY